MFSSLFDEFAPSKYCIGHANPLRRACPPRAVSHSNEGSEAAHSFDGGGLWHELSAAYFSSCSWRPWGLARLFVAESTASSPTKAVLRFRLPRFELLTKRRVSRIQQHLPTPANFLFRIYRSAATRS
jgi:hypothetical protein